MKLVLNYWKKEFKCSGSIKSSKEKSKDGKDAKLVQFIELFGNKSNEVKEFLIKEGIGIEENIIIYDKKG